jgi:peptide/nickel transport system permease protein
VERQRRSRRLLAVLAFFHGLVLLAGFFAPYHYATQNRTLPYAPPSRLRWVDSEGEFHLRPFVYPLTAEPGAPGGYREDRGRTYPLRLVVRGESYELLGLVRWDFHLFGVDEPGRIFLFGTDGFGRDQFSRLLYGGQISLFAGLLAAGVSLTLGTLLGVVSGFYGRWVDAAIMRGSELFMALPWLYLLLGVRAFLPLQISPLQTFLLLVILIGLIGWAAPARLVRGVVLSARERGYVQAARGFGAPDRYLLRRHLLPETAGVVLTQATLLVPRFILAEVTLSYLGLGVAEPVPSWGNMLGELQKYHVLVSYWWMFVPGAVLVLVLAGYQSLARALQTNATITICD